MDMDVNSACLCNAHTWGFIVYPFEMYICASLPKCHRLG